MARAVQDGRGRRSPPTVPLGVLSGEGQLRGRVLGRFVPYAQVQRGAQPQVSCLPFTPMQKCPRVHPSKAGLGCLYRATLGWAL